MKILVTGSNGFVGKNLVATLQTLPDYEILKFDRDNSLEDLEKMCSTCDFVVHLAGVNRPKDPKEFYEGNKGLTEKMLEYLTQHNNRAPIFISSSIQAKNENDYGQSKKQGEELILAHQKQMKSDVYIYRLPNLFGKWSRPFYNTVVATWCHQIARDENIEISNPDHELELVYIDDLIREIMSLLQGKKEKTKDHYYTVAPSYKISLQELAQIIQSFNTQRTTRFVPNMSDPLVSKLYSTYLSFLPKESFSYPLVTHEDERGSFTEFVKSDAAGQVSINISKPGIAKGNHWHHSKNEKFLVVKGEGVIRFRDIFSEEIIEYYVSDEKLEVVDIPTGYTHNIINQGQKDMITIMWVNEPFDPNRPDTYFEEVIEPNEKT